MIIIKGYILHYYFQLHISAPSIGAIFRLTLFSKEGNVYN